LLRSPYFIPQETQLPNANKPALTECEFEVNGFVNIW
jgi:hypothetical protein